MKCDTKPGNFGHKVTYCFLTGSKEELSIEKSELNLEVVAAIPVEITTGKYLI